MPSWATDSDGRRQRWRRTSPVLGKKSLSRALVKKVTELTPPGEKKLTERAQRWPQRGEQARRAGTSGGLPRTAAEAVADVAHGGVFLCVCNSVTVVQKLWFFTHGHTKVVQTTKPLPKNTRFAWAEGTCPRFAWAGGTFFPVVLLCQFLVPAGNRFWLYILLCTWSTIQWWCFVSFFGSGGK